MSPEEQSEYVFTWKIKNYSSYYQAKGQYIQSPGFTVETLSGSQWSLKLYPKGDSGLRVGESYISIFLEWKSLNQIIETATISCCTIEIVDEINTALKYSEFKNHKFGNGNPTLSYHKFISIDELDKQISCWAEDVLTIRCRIKIDKQHKQTIVGSVACTTIDVDRFCVDWNVEIPSLFEHTESITFPISELYNLDITLISELKALRVLINFKKEQFDVAQQLTFTISIFDKRGSKLDSKRALHCYEIEEKWKFPEFITKELLRKCEVNSSQFVFKLKCEVCIPKKNISSNLIERLEFVSSSKVTPILSDNTTSSMQTQYRNLFVSNLYSDVTIRGKSDEFLAHKFVLKVRSPVFATMFEQDMLENKTGVVDVVDLDGKTLKAFLEYLYTETVGELDYDIAKKLMLTADKYQVPSLVDECASFLKSNVSIENVCEIIAIADLLNCENLKSYALNFIQINAAEILPTAAWAEWIEGNIKLATYILSKFSAAISTSALH